MRNTVEIEIEVTTVRVEPQMLLSLGIDTGDDLEPLVIQNLVCGRRVRDLQCGDTGERRTPCAQLPTEHGPLGGTARGRPQNLLRWCS